MAHRGKPSISESKGSIVRKTTKENKKKGTILWRAMCGSCCSAGCGHQGGRGGGILVLEMPRKHVEDGTYSAKKKKNLVRKAWPKIAGEEDVAGQREGYSFSLRGGDFKSLATYRARIESRNSRRLCRL